MNGPMERRLFMSMRKGKRGSLFDNLLLQTRPITNSGGRRWKFCLQWNLWIVRVGYCTNMAIALQYYTTSCAEDSRDKIPQFLIDMAWCISGKREKPPCLHHWMVTIRGFQRLWTILNRTYKVKTLKPRYINQDGLENFFGNIRSCGRRHVNPTPKSFIYAFKSCLVNQTVSKHSPLSNCEDDFCERILTDLDGLLAASKNLSVTDPQSSVQ